MLNMVSLYISLDRCYSTRQKLVIGVNVMLVEANRLYQLHRIPTGSDAVLSSSYIRSRHIFFRAKVVKYFDPKNYRGSRSIQL